MHEGTANGGIGGRDAVEDSREGRGCEEERVVRSSDWSHRWYRPVVREWRGWRIFEGLVESDGEHAFDSGHCAVNLLVQGGQRVEYPLDEVGIMERTAPHWSCVMGFDAAMFAVRFC